MNAQPFVKTLPSISKELGFGRKERRVRATLSKVPQVLVQRFKLFKALG